MPAKVHIVSLGCPRNLVDSEIIAARLKKKRLILVEEAEGADTVIINTCSFIRSAKEESIDFILDAIELKKQGKIKKIVVAGCLAQRYPDDLVKELKEVDAFIGRQDLSPSNERALFTPPHYAYLKICEGCFNNCSFCVIPAIKGKFKSRPEEDILREARILDEAGIRELNIIGQDITCFGLDASGKPRLAVLVSKIIRQARNIKWVRMLYLNPLRIDRDLIELIKSEKKLCKYIDMPVQHINDRILKLMNRRTAKKNILSLIARLRRQIPDVAIRTAVIAGFPTETDKEFKELLEFVSEARFERLGAFIYSREEDTAAYNFPDQVPQRAKEERFDALMLAQQEVARNFNRSLKGKVRDVIIDEKAKGATYIGRLGIDAPEVDGEVVVKSAEKLSCGDIIKVKITEGYEYDLVGEKTAA